MEILILYLVSITVIAIIFVSLLKKWVKSLSTNTDNQSVIALQLVSVEYVNEDNIKKLSEVSGYDLNTAKNMLEIVEKTKIMKMP